MLKNRLYILLFFYHLLFIVFSYFLAQSIGGDSLLYWAKTFDIAQYNWFHFASYGAKSIVFLNYPLIKIGLPFWFGFLLYGIIGFFGILKWVQWAELVTKDHFNYKGFNFLYLLFFLPNLHVWTATLGKEAFIFWGIAAVIYAFTTQNFKTFSFIAGSLTVLIIRPHVALMLLSAIAIVFLFHKGFSLKKRITVAAVSFTGVLALLYAVFQTTNINYWDWERIKYFNEYSVLSFRHSGSYVPMLEYNYFYKWFSFQFRPLFFDAHSIFSFLASIENAFSLAIFIVALFFALRFYHKINFTPEMKLIFLFTFIAGLLYVERYANLGIFMRTKIMFQPFLTVSLLMIIHQGFRLMKDKKNE
ncbi:hypothetical protein [Flavobacterium terrisoli]|uniref:hypothetical protein n=1 Tax=Flavobacterium terrisoli TaxID=3242195 RepID=UPI0025428D12|nr:hypothetical protein [Flavobacterium buctense]